MLDRVSADRAHRTECQRPIVGLCLDIQMLVRKNFIVPTVTVVFFACYNVENTVSNPKESCITEENCDTSVDECYKTYELPSLLFHDSCVGCKSARIYASQNQTVDYEAEHRPVIPDYRTCTQALSMRLQTVRCYSYRFLCCNTIANFVTVCTHVGHCYGFQVLSLKSHFISVLAPSHLHFLSLKFHFFVTTINQFYFGRIYDIITFVTLTTVAFWSTLRKNARPRHATEKLRYFGNMHRPCNDSQTCSSTMCSRKSYNTVWRTPRCSLPPYDNARRSLTLYLYDSSKTADTTYDDYLNAVRSSRLRLVCFPSPLLLSPTL